MIITTSNFRSASDGGGLNVYPHIERGVQELIEDQRNINVNDNFGELSEPEAEHNKDYEDFRVKEQPLEVTDTITPMSSVLVGTSGLQVTTGIRKGKGRKNNKKHGSRATSLPQPVTNVIPTVVSIHFT